MFGESPGKECPRRAILVVQTARVSGMGREGSREEVMAGATRDGLGGGRAPILGREDQGAAGHEGRAVAVVCGEGVHGVGR
jgi:hypothetical protein